MKQILKVLLFVILNILELLVILLSLAIFTSPFEIFPWYEPDSIEFLAIFLLTPFYVVIGGILVTLGAVLHISKANKLLPFATIGGFVFLTILVSGGAGLPESFYLIVSLGICFGCAMFIATIISTIKNLIGLTKSAPTEGIIKSLNKF